MNIKNSNHNDDELFEDELIDDNDAEPKHVRVKCRECYQFGNYFESCWYIKFLAPDKNGVEGTRNLMRRTCGHDRQGAFCSTFRLPLDKVE